MTIRGAGLLLLCAWNGLYADESSAAVDRILDSLRASSAPGCAIGVIHNGRFVYTSAFGLANLETGATITPETPFNVASISKQFTAAALYFLVADGKVRLADSVRRFIPELPDYTAAITIGDLLHHTSGLRDSLLEVSGRLNDSLDAAAHLRLLAAQSALNFAPGTDYEYSNPDYILLGIVVQRVSGVPLADFAAARLFRPLGMTHTGFYPGSAPPAGAAVGYAARGAGFRPTGPPPLTLGDGGVYTTLSDLLLWDRNFYTGSAGGPRFLRFMQTPGRLASGERLTYAAGLTIDRYRGLPVASHDGELPGYRADMTRFPRQHLTAIVLSNRGDAPAESLSRRIAAVYLGGKFRRPPAPADIVYAKSAWPELDGAWESRQGWLLRAWSAVDGLSISTAGDTYKLVPLNRHSLVFDDGGGFRLLLTRLDRDRFQLQWEGGARPVVYHRLPAAPAGRLSDFAGSYRSSDAGAEFRMVPDGPVLLLTTGAGWKIPLDGVAPDRFAVGPWSLAFVRDSAGRVSALQLHRARLWNLHFERLSEPQP